MASVEHLVEWHEERGARGAVMAAATLACPACDAPVALPERSVAPSRALSCPYCGRAGAVRDFLSFGDPVRPARVMVRVALHAPAGAL